MARTVLQMEGCVDSVDGITVRYMNDESGWPGLAFRIFDDANREKQLRVEFSRVGFVPPKIGVFDRLRITVDVINEESACP